MEPAHAPVGDLVGEGRPRFVLARTARDRDRHLAVEALGLGGPDRLDLQEPPVEAADVVLAIVEGGPPAVTFECPPVGRLENPTMAAGTAGGAAERCGHDDQCERTTLWIVSPENV